MIASNVFSIVPNKNKFFYSDLKEGYLKWIKEQNLHRNTLTFTSWCYSKIPDMDLDGHAVIVGEARSGKDTLMLWYFILIYAIRNNCSIEDAKSAIIALDLLRKLIIYTSLNFQNNGVIFNTTKSTVGIDEGALAVNKKRTMYGEQVDYTSYLDVLADNNNVIFTLIQNLTNLDSAIINKAVSVTAIYERGKSLLYTKNKNFPIIKHTYNFDHFQKNQYLLKDKNLGIHRLQRDSLYSGKIKWSNLGEQKDCNVCHYKSWLGAFRCAKCGTLLPIGAFEPIPADRIFTEYKKIKKEEREKFKATLSFNKVA